MSAHLIDSAQTNRTALSIDDHMPSYIFFYQVVDGLNKVFTL